MSNPSERYLNTEEAAEFVRVSKRTLTDYRLLGGGPRFHKIGRRVVYSQSELVKWMGSHLVGSTSGTSARQAGG